jgi:hypothetical protein
VVTGSNGAAQVTGLAATINATHANRDDALALNGLGGDDSLTAGVLAATAIRLTEDGGTGNEHAGRRPGPRPPDRGRWQRLARRQRGR